MPEGQAIARFVHVVPFHFQVVDDGVVIVPRGDAEWALAQSEARIAKEEQTRAKLAAGELGVDFYGLRAKLAELGVEYVDRLTGDNP